jgi:propanol-preferring alcohol dehydrogenase
MRAMVLRGPKQSLELVEQEPPEPTESQVQIRVAACGVCRTDVQVVDGELPSPRLPLVPGHEIVGTVTKVGPAAHRHRTGDRVGVPWLGWTCGECAYCRSGRENLCDRALFTGYTIDGGYADYSVADERYVFALPPSYSEVEAAPLLCAGMIGYRALRLAGEARRIGFYGFGAAAHIAVQVARHRGCRVFAFTRPGDRAGQEFALRLGADWAGGSDERPPEPLDAALIFAPVGALVPAALAATDKAGVVVCAGIHMSDIPAFPYERLWQERGVRSVANLTRQDGEEFLAVAQEASVRTFTTSFALTDANEALRRVRVGPLEGAAVLVPGLAGAT